MLDWQEPRARASDSGGLDALNGARIIGVELAVVREPGHEPAEVRMHSECAREKDTAVGAHDGFARHVVLEDGRSHAVGMDSVRYVWQLLRISEQHEVPCRRPHGDGVTERKLSRLVDEEVVEELVRGVRREAVDRSRDDL